MDVLDFSLPINVFQAANVVQVEKIISIQYTAILSRRCLMPILFCNPNCRQWKRRRPGGYFTHFFLCFQSRLKILVRVHLQNSPLSLRKRTNINIAMYFNQNNSNSQSEGPEPCPKQISDYTHVDSKVESLPIPLHKVHRFQLAETSNAGKLSGNVDCRLSTVDYRLSTIDCRLSTIDYRLVRRQSGCSGV